MYTKYLVQFSNDLADRERCMVNAVLVRKQCLCRQYIFLYFVLVMLKVEAMQASTTHLEEHNSSKTGAETRPRSIHRVPSILRVLYEPHQEKQNPRVFKAGVFHQEKINFSLPRKKEKTLYYTYDTGFVTGNYRFTGNYRCVPASSYIPG